MAKTTIAFGTLLIMVGVIGFAMTGSAHPTALIPCWFGVLLALAGKLAKTEDAKRRMLWMHIAATIGLLGFLFPGFMAVKALVTAHGSPLARPEAVAEQGVMAVVCLVFVVLCVRSLIAARRARTT